MTLAFASLSRETRLKDLSCAAQSCTLCSRLGDRVKVLSECNGSPDAQIMFVAEAPGRLGADQTGIPLCGDRTGDNFEALIGSVGWRREDLFTTNAVLCNPRSEDGNNDRPTSEELYACSPFLRMQIELVEPTVIATLGSTALEALTNLHPHPYRLAEHVARPLPWAGRTIFPLYHPSPLATCHRSTEEQMEDFAQLSELASDGGCLAADTPFREPGAFKQLLTAILTYTGPISYFKLTKLMYLSEWEAFKSCGRTISNEVYIRANDGPWPPNLNDVLAEMDGHEVTRVRRYGDFQITLGPSPRFTPSLTVEQLDLVLDVVETHGGKTKAAIKKMAYFTEPMRAILRREKRQGHTRNGAMVLYRDRSAADES